MYIRIFFPLLTQTFGKTEMRFLELP